LDTKEGSDGDSDSSGGSSSENDIYAEEVFESNEEDNDASSK